MKDISVKALFGILIFIILLLVWFLIATLFDLPKNDISNWQECTGTIIAVDNKNYLISYTENGNTHYYMNYSTYASSSKNELQVNDTIKLFYYKNDPSDVSLNAPYNLSFQIGIIVFCLLSLTLPTSVALKSLFKPKNGIREHLELIETNIQNNTTNYVFLWEKDGKQKQLSSPFGARNYSEILANTGIKSVVCYMKNEKSNICYADINETLEVNNIIASTSINTYII